MAATLTRTPDTEQVAAHLTQRLLGDPDLARAVFEQLHHWLSDPKDTITGRHHAT